MTEVIVLCYHAVSPKWRAPLSVTPDMLERQLSLLVRRGWRGMTFRDALLRPVAPRTLAVTFDDGFASVLELAYPILARLGLPATLFVPTDFISGGGQLCWPGIDSWAATSDADELDCLDWEGLGQLAEAGWEIGSHTRTHPHLTKLDQTELESELAQSRLEIADRLGGACTSIAYPYGDVDDRVAAQAGRAGYTYGASLSSSLAPLGLLRWPRLGIYNVDTLPRFALKATRGMRWLRATPHWHRG